MHGVRVAAFGCGFNIRPSRNGLAPAGPSAGLDPPALTRRVKLRDKEMGKMETKTDELKALAEHLERLDPTGEAMARAIEAVENLIPFPQSLEHDGGIYYLTGKRGRSMPWGILAAEYGGAGPTIEFMESRLWMDLNGRITED